MLFLPFRTVTGTHGRITARIIQGLITPGPTIIVGLTHGLIITILTPSRTPITDIRIVTAEVLLFTIN